MERMVELGLTKSIGVSNCGIQLMLDIFTYAKIKPAVNQIEVHPYLAQIEAIEFQQKKLGVQVEAYAPLSVPAWKKRKEDYKEINIMKDPLILELAEKYKKTTA